MADPTPIPTPDQAEADDPVYEFLVLRKMLQQLPGRTGQLLLEQFDKAITTLGTYNATYFGRMQSLLEDAIVDIKYQQFDLEATRRERDELKKKLS